jgi:hypothetical protein
MILYVDIIFYHLDYMLLLLEKINKNHKLLIQYLDTILALIVLAGVFVLLSFSLSNMISMDWYSVVTFYEFINLVLVAAIGLELARMLLTHNLLSVIELIGFVVARKMLTPDLKSIDLLISIVALGLVIFLYFIIKKFQLEK